MENLLIFNFDGTDNEPADAMQDKRDSGVIEDDSITNILKLHLLLGGNLRDHNGKSDLGKHCVSFYYKGVGTYGNYFERKFNAGLALENSDVKTILASAKQDFAKHYQLHPPEQVLITGFSRGAALARRFASIISRDYPNASFKIIEVVFDTVASIGLPNLKKSERPSTDVVFEYGHTLPNKVCHALHMLSLDDKRAAFQPTLMNIDKRVTEIWFAGAHSDVGGGYNYDGLSDTSLRFAMDWLENLDDLNIQFNSPSTIDYLSIFPDNSRLNISIDDMLIEPYCYGVNHQQQRGLLATFFTVDDRLCCALENDQVSPNIKPKVHISVALRIAGDRNYRPKSLKNVSHQIMYDPWRTAPEPSQGTAIHELGLLNNYQLADQPITSKVLAHRKYNHTGIILVKGKQYLIENTHQARWKDGNLQEVDGEGWDRSDVKLGLGELPIQISEAYRRVPDADWFSLCATIHDSDEDAFYVGNRIQFTATKTGELCLFANDLNSYYGNNTGHLRVQVQRL
ncbi:MULTISPECIES: phospholipase effector Tle1 domain-containing protein [unclassified Agarivorans]|uniref:phospholipase effector Tle1 domain-containing protein n=1 Tax=unclassified Agarivorans TaxID=2636026 RepID=UPI003D7EBE4D